MRYRRDFQGNCYFFTLLTQHRRPIFAEPKAVERLRAAFKYVRARKPFSMPAIVVLPDHLHCIWELPEEDSDFPMRWMLIKRMFSMSSPSMTLFPSASQRAKRERGIWQRRYWEHRIRDDGDRARHLDYIHYNPVKHGYVASPWDWPYSSLAACARRGWYPANWGVNPDHSLPTPVQTGE